MAGKAAKSSTAARRQLLLQLHTSPCAGCMPPSPQPQQLRRPGCRTRGIDCAPVHSPRRHLAPNQVACTCLGRVAALPFRCPSGSSEAQGTGLPVAQEVLFRPPRRSAQRTRSYLQHLQHLQGAAPPGWTSLDVPCRLPRKPARWRCASTAWTWHEGTRSAPGQALLCGHPGPQRAASGSPGQSGSFGGSPRQTRGLPLPPSRSRRAAHRRRAAKRPSPAPAACSSSCSPAPEGAALRAPKPHHQLGSCSAAARCRRYVPERIGTWRSCLPPIGKLPRSAPPRNGALPRWRR
mmetsp:Transcript_10449/g.25240  ORF Transcript_10449/g.25240 Transcript_10449/m.25240 type:complete len:292 (-) Transcript_10449:1340-2215(-)